MNTEIFWLLSEKCKYLYYCLPGRLLEVGFGSEVWVVLHCHMCYKNVRTGHWGDQQNKTHT